MTPPDEYVMSSAPRALTRGQVSFDRLYLDIPLLTDLFVLCGLVLGVRLTTGLVDSSTGLFVLTLALLLARSRDGERKLHLSALDDVGKVFNAAVLSFATMSLLTLTLPRLGDPYASRSLLWVVGLSVPALFVGRMLHYSARRAAARHGVKSKTLIIGAGQVAQELVSTLRNDASYGLEVVGAVDDSARFDSSALGAPLLGNLADMPRYVKAHDVGSVIVAFSGANDASALKAVRELLPLDIDIWVVPRFFEMGGDLTGFDHIGPVPLVKAFSRTQSRRGWRTKRILDVVMSTAGVVLTAPLMGLIALLVKLDSRGPVLYKQERVGVAGRPIHILKFRTMIHAAPGLDDEWSPGSDRVTRVGQFLRVSGLDELPQLFNVLRGDLTLVGPRPERPTYVAMFDAMYPHYSDRHRVPAGVTGWAQIHGLRGDTSIDERARFDNYYIENWSLGKDLKIFLLTVRTLLKRYRVASTEPLSHPDSEEEQPERSTTPLPPNVHEEANAS